MVIEDRSSDSIITLFINENLIENNMAYELKDYCLDRFDEKHQDIELDLSTVNFMDSHSIGVMLSLAKELKKHDCALRLIKTRTELRDFLNSAFLDRFIDIQ